MRKIVSLLAVSLGFALPVRAQPAVLQASSPTTASLYAQERIELLPGFSTTTDGFEARITLLASAAGSWSKPLPWTPFVRNPAGAGSTVGMIGIHTHVLPNGKVLTWKGHNDWRIRRASTSIPRCWPTARCS